jgi:hypothetical protein
LCLQAENREIQHYVVEEILAEPESIARTVTPTTKLAILGRQGGLGVFPMLNKSAVALITG